ncbi:MAG: PDZ domain-containing protein [Candidatus Aminicenantes bacterium]|nr:PDZ domain-containing protein [Candidatus Aminicenantes bacterium]
MKRTRFILFAVLFGMSLLLLLEMTYLRGVSSHSGTPKNLYLLEAVIRLIRNDYLEEKNPVQVMEGSFKGMINSLDSLSGYLDAGATKKYLDRQTGTLQEPGVVLFKRYGAFPQVTGVIENSPAEKQGLEWGDLITEIDGRPTPAMSLTEVNLLLGDSEGTPLPLKLLRGEKTIELEIERAPLFSEPVTFEKHKGASGILRIHRLSPPCVSEIETRIMPELKKGRDPLVIDLRNCREGDFEETRKLINLFIKSESVGYFEKRGGDKEIMGSPDDPPLARLPLIIWINQGTVGPAEAAAAVLREFKRAQLVGLATPGLAARYEFHPLEDGTSVLLTSGIFSLNSGVKIWGRGAEPDIAVDVDDQDLAAFLHKTHSLLSAS